MNPGRTRNAYFAAAQEAESASKRKYAGGGQRKSLKRLNSAKEIQGFELDFFGSIWNLLRPAWFSFPKNLDFLLGDLEIVLALARRPYPSPRSWQTREEGSGRHRFKAG